MSTGQIITWKREVVEDVKVIAPEGITLSAFLDAEAVTGGVFTDERIGVLDRLSRSLLAHPELRRDPSTVALAFWLRKANLVRLRTRFMERNGDAGDSVIVPAGRVFHVAPANVDTLFVYSWALSFLCGNRNAVRLSTRTGGLVTTLIAVLTGLMKTEPLLADGNAFIQYERSDEINEALSLWCHHRIVWGGDDSVNALRRARLNPHASERAFASKYSWSVIHAGAWLDAGSAKQETLAEQFFNDVFWFDQMACSSPHAVCWIGAPADRERAVTVFDAVLTEVIKRKGAAPDFSVAVQRRNRAFSVATTEGVQFDPAQTEFTSVRLRESTGLDKEICGGGFLLHAGAGTLLETVGFVTELDQTVTHFGFPVSELREFAAAAGARGLDRIVPIGEALAFAPEWDGYDLLKDFTRTVTLRL
jgi:hypothetical protein